MAIHLWNVWVAHPPLLRGDHIFKDGEVNKGARWRTISLVGDRRTRESSWRIMSLIGDR
jgi:hypothetical protein